MPKTNRPALLVRIISLGFPFLLLALPAQSQRTFETSLSAGDLGNKHALWEDAHGRRPPPNETVYVYIPMLEIYSPSGVLIYHGTDHDTGRAAQILNSLPNVPSPPPSPDVQMSLSEILEITPDLAKWKDTILKDHHFVVVSISALNKGLPKNSPYYVQNSAVSSIPKRPGVDIDIVHINISFPQN